ncbi:c-type cytochrome biogenesis protein CcmI [Modicisalibacter coralii]|uniref:c-type cytochrome biogenesis protein CcmI n=1 Tax=Modicisalibacter coralii TaxID=2304602 RepID=UPI00100AFDDF|nr:c-type cytochrome biogenesis protein CcmI [Halomonas coralii]
MNLLWLSLALLLLPALWLVILPLRRATAVHAAQRAYEAEDTGNAENLAVYRQRLVDLEAARERGELDAERFAESRLELDRSLLDDTRERRHGALKPAAAGRALVPLLLIALAGGSLLWYQHQGAEGDLALYAAEQSVRNDPDGSLAMLIERLETQAERQPDNPKVWYELFPLYRDSGRLDKAADSLERLIALEGRRPGLLAQLAQVRFFAAERTLTDEVQALVDETLAKDPRQPVVLGMLGIEAFDHARYQEAIDYWRRAIAGYGDSASVQALREGIAAARQRLGVPAERSGPQPAIAEEASLSVRVSLAPALRERVAPGDSVFLVARDVAGELPPLAVARATVADLPLTVTLDDGDAMTPQATLSRVDRVRLVARVSKSGQATPQPGDLVGEAGPVAVTGDGDVQAVRIDRVVE